MVVFFFGLVFYLFGPFWFLPERFLLEIGMFHIWLGRPCFLFDLSPHQSSLIHLSSVEFAFVFLRPFPFQTVRKTIFSPFFWLCWPQFCLDIRFEIAFCLSFFSFCCLVTHRSIGYEALNQISNGGAGFEFSVGVSASFRLNFCTDLILVVFFFTGIGSQFRLIFIRVFRLNWLKTANC